MFAAIAFALAVATPLATAVGRLLADYCAAWSRADSVALAALHTPDGELVSPAGSAIGYRRYDHGEPAKLRYIRNAKALHLSLKDIAAPQQRLLDGPAFCAAVVGWSPRDVTRWRARSSS